MDEERIRQIFREELGRLFGSSPERFVLSRTIQIADGRSIQTGRTFGTRIGTAADQRIGFFGSTPVTQPVTPTDAASTIVALQDLGLVQ